MRDREKDLRERISAERSLKRPFGLRYIVPSVNSIGHRCTASRRPGDVPVLVVDLVEQNHPIKSF
jgi:hypothetical protein